jgi:hypothetical protein
MTNPTSNFGWQMPTPTDLVTDLPADFEVFGQAVDTDFVDLLGGTTGQVLSKTTNTDLDFTWVTPEIGDITAITVTAPITGGGTTGSVGIAISGATTSAAGAVQLSDSTSTTSSVLASTPTATKAAYDLANAAIAKSTVTTAGDIIYRNATVPVRLGIGTTGQVLRVNSGATAPEWATPASGGGMTLLSTTTLSGTSTAITGISGAYNNLFVVLSGVTGSTAGEFRLNGDTTGIYAANFFSYSTTVTQAINNSTLRWNSGASVTGNIIQAYTIYNYASTSTIKSVSQVGGFMDTTTGYSNSANGFKNTTSAITSITVTSDGAAFTAGTVLIYGVK